MEGRSKRIYCSEARSRGCRRWPRGAAENTQIYEGTNQIQRMVMGRQLLK
jgi:alkylation response protein AidB-like acyl-CoA dehydrogenase